MSEDIRVLTIDETIRWHRAVTEARVGPSKPWPRLEDYLDD